MKKVLNKLIIMTVFLSAQNLFAWTGSGTALDPYQISSQAELTTIATNVNGGIDTYSGIYFKQTADISLSGSWTAIGVSDADSFRGIYDGNGKKITGLTINSTSTNFLGLFGWIYGATIKNLGVEGVSVAGNSYVGGLIGLADNNSHILNCYSTGTVSASAASTIIGGLVGSSWDNNEITNCYSRASVSGSNPGYVGGLIGYLMKSSYSSNISYCYSTGAVSTNGGGFVGIVDGSSTITACFWDNQTSLQTHGVAGGGDVAGVTGETTTAMKTKSTFTGAGWDNTGTIWRIDLTLAINDGYPFLAWQNPSGGTALPVELTSFTSAVNKNSVTLNWSTATEVNNYGFDVERRAVNSQSSTVNSWAKIGFVAGNGTTNSPKSYSYADASLASGRYAYRLKQIDNDGAFKYSQSIELGVNLAPATIGLSQNYPNPFNPSTQISFSVSNTEQAKLVVYNLSGQAVMTLFDGVAIGQQAYQLSFDASKLASGVYFYKLETPSRIDVKRMQLLK